MGTFVIFRGDDKLIALEGEMTSSSPLDFLRALRDRPKANIVLLNSQGGPLDSALILAREINERGLATHVPPESACVSTCSIVFLGGTIRLADGVLGIRQIDNYDPVSTQTKLADVLEAFRDFGVAREVELIMLRTSPKEMHVFTDKELRSFTINKGELLSYDPRG